MQLANLPPGSKIVKLVIETEQKLLKLDRVTGAPCPTERLIKRSELSVILGSSYQNAVNKQLEKAGEEANFEPQLLWRGEGQHVDGHPFLVKKKGGDKLYLAFRLLHVVKETYFDDRGLVVDPTVYQNYLPTRVGEEPKVVWRTVSLSNVRSVIYDGKEWII